MPKTHLNTHPLRVVVTGASGLLGSNLCVAYREDHEVIGLYRSNKLELQGVKSIGTDHLGDMTTGFISQFQPDLIIHAAGEANVDACDRTPDLARAAIVTLTKQVADVAADCGAYFIHISTDSLFDGTSAYCNEKTPPNPINSYAELKLEAEQYINFHYPESCIVRTRFYGWNPGHKFCFTEHVINSLLNNESINCFTDIYCTQIYVHELARIFLDLYRVKFSGTVNIVENERWSRYEFSKLVAEVFELDNSLLVPKHFSAHSTGAMRPRDTSLSNELIRKVLGRDMQDTKTSLEHMRKNKNPARIS